MRSAPCGVHSVLDTQLDRLPEQLVEQYCNNLIPSLPRCFSSFHFHFAERKISTPSLLVIPSPLSPLSPLSANDPQKANPPQIPRWSRRVEYKRGKGGRNRRGIRGESKIHCFLPPYLPPWFFYSRSAIKEPSSFWNNEHWLGHSLR